MYTCLYILFALMLDFIAFHFFGLSILCLLLLLFLHAFQLLWLRVCVFNFSADVFFLPSMHVDAFLFFTTLFSFMIWCWLRILSLAMLNNENIVVRVKSTWISVLSHAMHRIYHMIAINPHDDDVDGENVSFFSVSTVSLSAIDYM